jgi:hypothetical protein
VRNLIVFVLDHSELSTDRVYFGSHVLPGPLSRAQRPKSFRGGKAPQSHPCCSTRASGWSPVPRGSLCSLARAWAMARAARTPKTPKIARSGSSRSTRSPWDIAPNLGQAVTPLDEEKSIVALQQPLRWLCDRRVGDAGPARCGSTRTRPRHRGTLENGLRPQNGSPLGQPAGRRENASRKTSRPWDRRLRELPTVRHPADNVPGQSRPSWVSVLNW